MRSGNLSLISGSMKVENAVVLNTKKEKRKQGGGGLWVEWGQVDQYGGDFSFLHCSSFFGGGIALLSSKIHQRDGSMSFHDCIAERYGGGMLIKHSKVFFTAHVSFSSCRASGAKGSGGAMAVFDNASLTSDKAEVRVHNCSAMKGGGFSIVQSSFTQHGGQLQLHHCSASDQGGGFFLESGKFEVGGTILVDTCTATSGGGGIFLEDHMQFHVYKDITFSNCRQVGTPSGFGGGLEVHNSDIVQSGGNVVFLVIAIVSSCFWCCPLKHAVALKDCCSDRIFSHDVFTFACVCHSILSVGSIGAKVQEVAEQLMCTSRGGNKLQVHSRLPIALPMVVEAEVLLSRTLSGNKLQVHSRLSIALLMVVEVEVLLSQIRILSSFVERWCSLVVLHDLTVVALTSPPTLP